MTSLNFEFEEREVNGKVYRLPILDMNKSVFKKIGKSSYKILKMENNARNERYTKAKQVYREKDIKNDEDEPNTCDKAYNPPVQDNHQELSEEEGEDNNEDFDDNFFGDEEEEKIDTENLPKVRYCTGDFYF